jgi:hypothetical protein
MSINLDGSQNGVQRRCYTLVGTAGCKTDANTDDCPALCLVRRDVDRHLS